MFDLFEFLLFATLQPLQRSLCYPTHAYQNVAERGARQRRQKLFQLLAGCLGSHQLLPLPLLKKRRCHGSWDFEKRSQFLKELDFLLVIYYYRMQKKSEKSGKIVETYFNSSRSDLFIYIYVNRCRFTRLHRYIGCST